MAAVIAPDTDPLQLAAEMVGVPSISGDEAAYVDWLAGALEGLGFEVERQTVEPDRDNLIARHGRPRVLFCTHTDTVPPALPPRIEGERLYGRGACDTKGLTAAMLVAASRLIASGASDLGFLFVVGEEVGHHGAKAAASLPLRVERLILGEPTENRIVTAQKGCWWARVEADGVAAHSGYPHLGTSAVERLLDTLSAVRGHAWPVDPELGPTTINIGRIEGGVAPNVLAPAAAAELLFRTVGPLEALADGLEVCRVDGVRVADHWGNPPIRYDVPAGYETTTVAFNTDGPFLTGLGPVVLVGPGTIEVAHTAHEHVDRADLVAGVALYERLARDILDA